MASWMLSQPEQLELTDEIRRLVVSLVAGRLSVVATDGPARVEVSRTGDAPLAVKLEDGVLSVRHPYPKTWPGILQPLWWWLNGGQRLASDVSIAVPVHTAVGLNVGSGSIVASGLQGDLSLECVSGRITMLGAGGQIRSKVVSGTIEALGCAGEVRLETVSGEITLADSATRRLHVKTISGALTADLDNPPRDSDIFLETVSGEITIRVREDSDLAVHLSATSGRVTSGFPALAVAGRWPSSVRGMIGAGTGRLHANATSGNISLLCRPVDDEFAEGASQSGEPAE